MNRSGVNLEPFVLHLGAITMLTSAETNCAKGGNEQEFDLNKINSTSVKTL